MENYHVLDIIGEGSFGKVYKGRKKYCGQVVALKFIPKVGRSVKELKNLRREIDIMRNLHHDNIIEMLDSFETDKEVVAVTDYAEGELFQILEDDHQLPEDQVQSIACQLVSALYYLHSHRILHRDMKPQNILLGKGGVVKLCDFGFARAMSINTLVLTSIKGTPLYMSPELVEEKPYDHTADLWALGCILYELFTGQPPFYTNSIIQLVRLIIKDPVRWPKNMSPAFKDFLQGLLTKSPRRRLSWPALLHHPFVAHGIKVNEDDNDTASPFTKAPTQSLILEREKQTKEKTNPPGSSKILSKAREKAEKHEKKPKTERTEAWGKEPGKKEPIPVHPERPHTQQWDNEAQPQVVPTPRTDRISQDYANEFPDVEVESRKVLNKPEKKPIENVKLNEEEADSEDEWQDFVDTTDPQHEGESALLLIQDSAFLMKLKDRLIKSSTQMLDGNLEGASRLRPALRVTANLVMLKCENDIYLKFLSTLDCPSHLLNVLEKALQNSVVKRQPWCQQIMIDLISSIHAYISTEILDMNNQEGSETYRTVCLKLISLIPTMFNQKFDLDLRLREQLLVCLILLCEQLEKSKSKTAEQIFQNIGKYEESIDAILQGSVLDEAVMKQLEEVAEGNVELAQQRMEDMMCLCVACLAALTHLPLTANSSVQGKQGIASTLAQLLTGKDKIQTTDNYLVLLKHPSTCSNVLKALYSCCQVSKPLCQLISESPGHIQSLLGILNGKVEVADMELNSVLEMGLHIFNVLLTQCRAIPPDLTEAIPFFISIFLESQLASHTAASALLFSLLMSIGVRVDVPPEELLDASLSLLTDIAQVCEKCPMDYGVLDGIIMLLYQVLLQSEGALSGPLLQSGVWKVLWHRVAQVLKVQHPESHLLLRDIDEMLLGNDKSPDWNLISFQGLLGVLQIAVSVFTKESFQSATHLTKRDGVVSVSLMHLISKSFLQTISGGENGHRPKLPTTIIPCFEMKPDGGDPCIEITLQVTQLLCFPFAIEVDEDLLNGIYNTFIDSSVVGCLLNAMVTYLKPEQTDLVMGLISRLVMGDENFIDQFVIAVDDCKAEAYLGNLLDLQEVDTSVQCDLLSIFSQLLRSSPVHLRLVNNIFKGKKGNFVRLDNMLSHEESIIRSRACSLLGNCLRHSKEFYPTMKENPNLCKSLVRCLRDDDPNTRKASSYALGNAAFHGADLYSKLRPSIGPLIRLLHDSVAKTRSNAASALGNLTINSTDLVNSLVQEKAVASLLDVACNDSQYSVQECALMALRSMCARAPLCKELKKQNAEEKLSSISERGVAALAPRMSQSMGLSRSFNKPSVTMVLHHTAKLTKLLND